MIFDRLENASIYEGVASRMPQAFAFLRRADLHTLAVGRYPIDGDHVFAIIQEYETRPVEKAIWESHRKYIDVQYIATGVERMGYGHIKDFEVAAEYDPARDFLLLSGKGNNVVVTSGAFVIFSPHDVHQPCVAVDNVPSPVRKIVVKVSVD